MNSQTVELPVLIQQVDAKSPAEFQRVAEPFRQELRLHCYRMLGSFSDAEDLVQETFIRAWRAFGNFEGRGSFRSWLYSIATNACLSAISSRVSARRVLPEFLGPPTNTAEQRDSNSEISWIEPYPSLSIEEIEDPTPGPHARYELRESVQLAFIAVIQHLPARQRAILLLCDVIGWSAIETSELLSTSVASVNSALQRARATLERRLLGKSPAGSSVLGPTQQLLLDRYVQAWETANLDGFISLLHDDASYSMPPWCEWYKGRESIRTFFTIVWNSYGGFRLVPTTANFQPAFAAYSFDGNLWRAHSIHVLAPGNDLVLGLTMFKDTKAFSSFGIPEMLN